MRTLLETASGAVLLAAGFLAPWVCGAQTTLAFGVYWIPMMVLASFVLWLCSGARLQIGSRAVVLLTLPVLVLLGCLVWWFFQAEPAHASPFSQSHWEFLQERFGRVMLDYSHAQLLIHLAAVILALLLSVAHSRKDWFRGGLVYLMGLSALAMMAYAQGMFWAGWKTPSWILIAEAQERWNVCFFHHNGPAACLNIAWPLLFFTGLKRMRETPRMAWAWRVVLLLLLGVSYPLWRSLSSGVVAGAVFFLGMLFLYSQGSWLWQRAFAGFCILACAIGLVQYILVAQLIKDHPDGWPGHRLEGQELKVRDQGLEALASMRGDRMIPSEAPARTAAWLAAGRMAGDVGWLGAGPGVWRRQAVLYSNDGLVNSFHQHRQFAHHDLLQFVSEWGWLPGLAGLVLLLGGIWGLCSGWDAQAGLRLGALLALVGTTLQSFVYFPLQNPSLQLWIALLLGLGWGLTKSAPSCHRPRAPSQV